MDDTPAPLSPDPASPDAHDPPPSARTPADAFGQPPPGTVLKFDYVASGGEFFWLQLVNGLFTFVTLGIYYAWARVRMLRFTIGAVRAGDDHLSFHAEGRDLFWGVLRAWALFVVPLMIMATIGGLLRDENEFSSYIGLMFYLVLFVFMVYSLMGSLRYRAGRTTWRGIRFKFTGTFSEFGGQYAVRILLLLVTLGIAYPFVATWRRRYIIEHLQFGGEPFGFDGEAGGLMPRYLLCWFFAIPTFGLSLLWFHGHQQSYFWNQTTLVDGRFRCAMTGGGWLRIVLLSAIFVGLTFGLAAPWAYLRLHREFFSRLSLVGADLARVRAVAASGDALGEGAADLLETDGGLDL